MKTKLTLALVALITSSAFGSLPKVLPEFKNEKQLAEWREEMAAKHAATTIASADHAFYTGKPYVESTGSYAFKYRSYNPELARWTSEDPSGFPDGANGNVCTPNPNSQLDPTGLMKVNGGTFAYDGLYENEFPGFFNYAAYGGYAAAFADGSNTGGSGSINMSGYIVGYSTLSWVHNMQKDPTISVWVDPNGNLNYTPSFGDSFGGADGVVGLGFMLTVEGTGTKALTFHVYGGWALSATTVSGIGVNATGGAIAFAGAAKADQPVPLGTFQFIVE